MLQDATTEGCGLEEMTKTQENLEKEKEQCFICDAPADFNCPACQVPICKHHRDYHQAGIISPKLTSKVVLLSLGGVFNWRGMDFPLLAACYSGSHHWPVFSLQGVQCWGNGKVCNKSNPKYSFYSDMCKCPMDTLHGTCHSAMTASNLCHMWRFILIYEKPLYVIFISCLSVPLILFFDDLEFSYILV